MASLQKLLCLALLAAVLLVNGDEFELAPEEQEFAVELTADSFEEAVQGNNHFVMFFAPWCGHCKRLHPTWEQLAELMNVKEDGKVVIAKVDCTQHQGLCGKQEVTGYPTLRFYKLGEKESVKFKGSRDMPGITEFINQQLNSEDEIETTNDEDVLVQPTPKLIELTEENFAKHVSSGNHFVEFYAPWCSHCQRLAPTWEELSKSLQHETSVSIAKIDCTVYRPLCQDFDVKGYPTLLWIEDGKKIEKYSGVRDFDALKAYVEKMLGADAIKQGPPAVEEAEAKKPADQDKLQVAQLNGGDDFAKTVQEGVTFVKFYAPWCGHCQKLSPTWDQLAEKVHAAANDVRIAKVDCTTPENKNLCVEQEVEGYPTLFAYKNGEKQKEYDGSRTLPELQHYINKFAARDEL